MKSALLAAALVCHPHYRTMPYTWHEYAVVLDAELTSGKLDGGKFMTLCVVKRNGRTQTVPVYGVSHGVSPVGSLTLLPK